MSIANQIATRVDTLEEDGKEWIASFAKLVGVSPTDISLDPNDAGNFVVSFNNAKEADRFSKLLPRAGSYIQFVPAQLHVAVSNNPLEVIVRRNVGLHMEGAEMFSYVPVFEEDGSYSSALSTWVDDRAKAIVEVLAGLSPVGKELEIWQEKKGTEVDAFALSFSRELIDLENALGRGNAFLGKFLSRMIGGDKQAEKSTAIAAKLELLSKSEGLASENRKILEKGSDILKKNSSSLAKETKKVTYNSGKDIALSGVNPLFDKLNVDWAKGRMSLVVASDVKKALDEKATTERGS